MTNQQQNKTLIQKLFDDVYNKGNINTMDQLFSTDVILHDPAAANFKGGLQALKERETMYKNAFPNKTLKIEKIYTTDDDRVIAQWSCQGTHKGDLQDIQPTGKNVKITGISIYTIKNNKITEIDQNWDRLGLFEQLGVVETHAGALHSHR